MLKAVSCRFNAEKNTMRSSEPLALTSFLSNSNTDVATGKVAVANWRLV